MISISGPSVFEAICRFGPYGFAAGHMNAITPAYHWHLRLSGLARVRTRDEVHARSGRRVLFFELFEPEARQPFLRIYLYRAKGEAFDAHAERRFAEAHAELAESAAFVPPRTGEPGASHAEDA